MGNVSIIIPFFNRLGLVKEAIASVLDQTYSKLEIILIDDGSANDTKKQLDIKRERVRYIRQKNKGPGSARNLGLSLAKGDYVAFLDSDDQFLPTKLEKQVKLMERNASSLFSHTSYQRVERQTGHLEIVNSGRFSGNVYPQILYKCPIATPTVMIRRQIFQQGLKFPENVRTGEDIILWSKIARTTPILGIDESLTLIKTDGRSASVDIDSQITGVKNVFQTAINDNVLSDPLGLPRILSYKSLALSKLYWQKKEKIKSLLNGIFAGCLYPPVIWQNYLKLWSL